MDKKAKEYGQEYAHVYPTDQHQEDYQYENEDKRVKYHVDSDSEDSLTQDQLYGVQPESTLVSEEKPVNRIKARMSAQDVLEENRLRSYKVRNKPPIWDKADPGQEAYKLQEDPRDAEVNKIRETSKQFDDTINEERSRDISKPQDRYVVYKEDTPDADNNIAVINIVVGSKVKHTEEGLVGVVNFVGKDKVSIVWNDQTRERFSLSEVGSSLQVLSYVDSIQEEVDPLETQTSTKTDQISSDVDDIYNKALAALGEDEDDDIIEDGNPNKPKFDPERAKLQRQVHKLQAEVEAKSIDKVKQKAAIELTDLMQAKGLISNDKTVVASQVSAIMSMDDSEYETLKSKVLAGQMSSVDLALSAMDTDEDYSDIEDGQEYAKQREAMKKSAKPTRSVDGIEMGDTSMFENGGLANFKGNVGDFSQSMSGGSDSETRSVKRSDNGQRAQVAASQHQQTKLDLSGFQNLEGLTKPINITSKEITASTKYKEIFSEMNWTTISKVH